MIAWRALRLTVLALVRGLAELEPDVYLLPHCGKYQPRRRWQRPPDGAYCTAFDPTLNKLPHQETA
jgi:hypothetical protein